MIIRTNGICHDHRDEGAHEAALYGFARSPHFEVLERHARANDGACVMTGRKIGTQWHHARIPFHFARFFGRWELEFSSRNLKWFLQVHDQEWHRIFAHLLFFQSFNHKLDWCIQRYKGWSLSSIQNDKDFAALVDERPKSLRDYSPCELQAMKEQLNLDLPILPEELEMFAPYKPKNE